MKILYVADRINSPDGSSVHCRAFVQSSQELGHQVRSYPAIGPLPVVAVKVDPKDKNLTYYLKKINWKTLKRYLHRSNPYISELMNFLEGWQTTVRDYLHLKTIAEEFHPDAVVFRYRLFNFSPFWIAKAFNIPLVCEINALKSMESSLMARRAVATALTRWGERRAITRANAIFTVSEAIKQKIIAYAPKRKDTVAVIPNGVDLDVFTPDEQRRSQVKSQLGISDKRVLGYVGSYKNWHGLDTALDVIECLVRQEPKFHLLLIGHGTEFAKIERLIQEKGLASHVSQTGAIAHEKIPEYLAAFDYALMTYPKLDHFYFSPLKMFEYMAMGIQVVSTDVGQISEIIEHGKNGWLVDPPTADQFCKTVLEAETQGRDIGKDARELMENHYSWRNNAAQILKLAAAVK